ncbi:hypothetical protein PsorP6_001516 [Peronosclerospora sorghi]|uniref:Uncharacterized protein n=1 Tax=Peronosclerospora sorghi TaxID=230839 RepID=A0ACC0WVA2_9STRA|nr:hypothetical protein PsorP6_001516 [Peronosclerospora sorghi]
MYSFASAEPPNKAKEPGALRAAVKEAQRRKAQTRKEGAIARKHGLLIRITKNDLIQTSEAMHLDSCNVVKTDMVRVSLTSVKTHGISVGHETFSDRVDGVKNHDLT